MKVEQACRMSADGAARTKVRVKTHIGEVLEVDLYAKYNEVQERYTVTQYFNYQRVETSRQFLNPHKIDQWLPTRRFSSKGNENQPIKSKYCLYLLVSKEKYQFNIGITNNIYSKLYQLRMFCGEFDLGTSCIVYGTEKHLQKLEGIIHFIFEEYHLTDTTLTEDDGKTWFDLDCFWYVKNEIRRLNSFREEKIYRLYEGIDLNAFIIEDSNRLLESSKISTD